MSDQSTILKKDALLQLRRSWRAAGKTVVWTNGCFDLLHVGHVHSLERAKSLGDILVVGVNSDVSVRAIKGPTRPIVHEGDRAEMLAALKCVDFVHVFSGETPERILAELQPNVHCKGMEYAPHGGKAVPEASVVESYGGRIEYLDLVPAVSTTDLIDRIMRLILDSEQREN